MLEAISKTKKPVIISTGGSTLKEIKNNHDYLIDKIDKDKEYLLLILVILNYLIHMCNSYYFYLPCQN